MRIAAAAYPLDPVASWDEWEAKVERWVATARADLLVFPEYGGMELAHLDGPEVAGDLQASLHAAARHGPRAQAVWATLARAHRCHILSPSGPWDAGGARPVNRAFLHGPDGLLGHADKQVMTRFEREAWDVAPGDPLSVFGADGLRVGVAICYDAEFPAIAAAMRADILLVPSCTDTVAGWSRVRIAAAARALEGQCVAVHSPTVGTCPWSPAVDKNRGRAAILGPPDAGFPDDGILADGAMDEAGWVRADVGRTALDAVRREGQVLNRRDAGRAEAAARAVRAGPWGA